MQWSFPIARVAGSEIRIHLTFFLLLAWIGIVHFRGGGSAQAMEGIAFVIAIFACVVLHELGHALAAKRYGIATPRITLLPIGGVAELEKMPEKPSEEIIVALAGPLVNVVIAGALMLVLGARFDADTLAALEDPAGGFLARLAAVNIVLVLFNLIPAFPMDGGRVLRALLSIRYPRIQATRIAGTVGQIAAFVFGFLGLVGGNPLLIFVAIFVYLAATAETQVIGLQDAVRSVALRDAMITSFESLAANATLANAADLLLATTQHEFPVVDEAGRLRGFLTRAGLVEGMRESGPDTPVQHVMTTDIPLIAETGSLPDTLEALQQVRAPAVAIVGADQKLVGYVTIENLGELVMLRAAQMGT